MAGSKPIEFRNFSGIRPRASDIRLAIHEALTAENVDLRKGLLRPRARQIYWNEDTDPSMTVLDETEPETLFRFRHRNGTDFWMYWEDDVDVAAGPVDSSDQRHYYTGDGIPKMFTADSINDPTPPYPEDADEKYPYTWYALGVPAPETAPVIDETTLSVPGEGSVGLISGVTAEVLLIYQNASSGATSAFADSSCGRGGLYAGDTNSIRTWDGNATHMTCMRDGTRMRVTEIIDGDTVRVVASGRTGPIEDNGWDKTSNWRWDNGLPNDSDLTNLSHPWGGHRERRSFFCLPGEVVLEIEDHILRVNDVIRVSGSLEPMIWLSTPTMTLSAHPGAGIQFRGFRTMARPDSADIEFSGSVGFVIERNGEEIDPAVPATSAYDVSVRAYVYTYVSALGEESAPSPPSPVYTVRDGDPVDILSFAAPPTARRNIDRLWIYRTNTGDSGTATQYVGEVLIGDIAAGYEDTVEDGDLDEALETDGWDVPREDMRGIVALPNGIMAGFVENRLCFSVPGFPHAWPRDYEQLLDYDIVGLEVYENSVYVATAGKPYIATGTHPAQMSLRRVETLQACLDKRSMVNVGDRTLYCSKEGLISGGSDGFFNATEKFYTKEQWGRIVGPDTAISRYARAWYNDSQYILYTEYDTGEGTERHRLIFDFRDGEMRITQFTESIVAAYADPDTAELYYIVDEADQPQYDSEGGPLRLILRWDYNQTQPDEFDDVSPPTGFWTSGMVMLPYPMALSCARVLCRRDQSEDPGYGRVALTVNGRVYDESNHDGEDNDTIADNIEVILGDPNDLAWVGEQRSKPFRLEPNFLVDAIYITVEVEGTVEVEAVLLAENMRALEGS